MLDRLDTQEAYQLAHAFSLFFQLVNLCEERARERHLRFKTIAPMSLKHLFRELKAAGVTEKQLQAVLNELEVEPVLTAHPTEAKRRAVLNQMSRLTQQWENLQDGGFAGTVATAENGERGEAKRPGFVGEQPDIS